MFTNEIRPYKSYANHRKQTCDTPSVSQMGVLDVEARRFHGTKCRFNLPAFFIGRYSIFRSVETDQNLKFGYPFRVLDSTSGEIDILPFMQKELVVEFLLSDFKGIEEPPPDFVIVSPKNLRQRVSLFSDVLPSAWFGCKPPCSEVA